MALYKKEVLVRPNSDADFETAMNWTRDWLTNTFQDRPENRNDDGSYKDYFFADVFFAPGHRTNSGQTWRIYTDPCGQKYGLQPAPSGRIEFMIGDFEGMNDRLQDHEVRIEALENAEGAVEATVL